MRGIGLLLLLTATASATGVSEHGAIPGDNLDDAPAFQAAINVAILTDQLLVIPAGRYDFDSSLLVCKDTNNDGAAEFVSFTIRGPDVYPYDPGLGGIAYLNFRNPKGFGIGIQRAKGLTLRNLYLKGCNTISFADNREFTSADEQTGFTTNDCLHTTTAAHAAIVVDPFGGPTVADKYEEFDGCNNTKDHYVAGQAGGGSGTIAIENCRFQAWVAGLLTSPSGDTYNAEQITLRNCRIDQTRTAIALGQNQSRSVNCENLISWGPVLYLTDGSEYGQGSGPTPNMIGGNIAGRVKYLMRSNGTTTATSNWSGFFAESFYAIGSTNNLTTFTGCQFKLDWTMPTAATHFTCGPNVTTWIGCNIWYSANPPQTRGIQTSGRGNDFYSCRFDVAPFSRSENATFRHGHRYRSCEQRHLGNMAMLDTDTQQQVTRIERVAIAVDGESLEFTSADSSAWAEGDQVVTWQDFFVDENGESLRQYIGYVSSIQGDTVTISKVPYNVTSSEVWLSKVINL